MLGFGRREQEADLRKCYRGDIKGQNNVRKGFGAWSLIILKSGGNCMELYTYSLTLLLITIKLLIKNF